jgi:hypothetical protein
METELILADHTIATRRIERLEANIKKANREEDRKELEAVKKCLAALEKETPLRELDLSDEEWKRLRGFTFLSAKPLLVVLNLSESDAGKISDGRRRRGPRGVRQAPARRRRARLGEDRDGDRRPLARGRRRVPEGPRHRGAVPSRASSARRTS